MASRAVQDYHIGWICALDTEFTAAMAMLDEEHPMIAGQDKQDHNSYVLGRIHQHNVVIACMPAGVDGVVSAATVAKDMARTFPGLRVGLMVGIGGGIPNLACGIDIRLGDVVVSQPDKIWGGVVQYDHGKAESGGVFVVKGQLNQPPEFLLRTLAQVQARHRMRPSKIGDYINDAVKINPLLEENGFVRPDIPDQLLCTDCNSFVNNPIDECNGRHHRKVRKSLAPVLHYGIIASGNVVVKDAVVRDRLRDQFSALCVEMEAAGLMNDFPCLVIRGICDYADSSKNDVWHPYAAMTAAAFAKEFLYYVSPAQTSQEHPIHEVIGVLNALQKATQAQAQALRAQVQHFENDQYRRCHQAFKTSNYEEQKDINPDRVTGTCQWVLQHKQYRWWHDSEKSGLLWISADPGCGKSVLAKSLIDHELCWSSRHSICYFFFKDNEEQDNLATALCAIFHQLLAQQPHLIRYALTIYDPNKPEKVQKDVAQLWRTLLAATSDSDAQDVACVLDALDECQPRDRAKLIDMLAHFHAEAQARSDTIHAARLKFLVTSRPYDDIRDDFERTLRGLPTIRLRGEEENDQIHAEINLVIEMRVVELSSTLKLSETVRKQLLERLTGIDQRTYLWLYLALDHMKELLKKSRRPQLQILDQLPSSVEDAYEKILGQIDRAERGHAQDILQIVVGSRRPLTMREMAVAYGIAESRGLGANSLEEGRLDAQWVKASLRRWCGLFVFFNHNRIYLIHHTAKEFLLADSRAYHRSSGWKHCLSLHQTELQMARLCTDLLSFPDTQSKITDLARRCGGLTPLERILNADDEIETLVAYSAEHWPSHFRIGQSAADEGYTDKITWLYDEGQKSQPGWFRIFWQATDYYDDEPRIDALQLAALLGHEQRVSRILSSTPLQPTDNIDDGCKVNAATLWASRYGHGRVVQMLLEKGADVNAQGGRHANALQAASWCGCEMVVRMILNKGADVNAQGGEYGNALQGASAGGHEQVVQILLVKGADVNAQGGLFGNALQAASDVGHVQVVQMLLDQGADVNAQGGYHGNALQAASERGHVQVVQMLLDQGADVNAQGGPYGNALQAASFGGHETVVRMLLDAGADVHAQGGDYGNALQAASVGGHETVVQMLLDAGADVHAQGGRYGNALQAASFGGHETVVQMLLDAGADVHAHGRRYGNALQAASERGHETVVRMLLDAGADVNAQGGFYGNALQAASFGGHETVVQMLLDAGADVHAHGGRYGNALRAASECGHEEVVQMLLDQGADANAEGGEHGNALHDASIRGHVQVVRLLLASGANVNAHVEWGLYPNALQAAAVNGHRQVVQMLLDKGAAVNAEGGYYGEALQAASMSGLKAAVQMLLDKGADVNAQGGLYGNALQAAASGGHEQVVRMLLDAGADVHAQGGRYGNALQAASECGHEEVVQMLLDQGADVNAKGGKYGNALQGASVAGHVQVVQMLLANGADVNAQGGWHGNSLQAASEVGHVQVVQTLLAKGANVSARAKERCLYRDALQAASVQRHEQVVQMLLDKGAGRNAQGGR